MVGSTALLTDPERFLLLKAGISAADFEKLPVDMARTLYSDLIDFNWIPRILEVKNHKKVNRLATAVIAGIADIKPSEPTWNDKHGTKLTVSDRSISPGDCKALDILLKKKYVKLPRDVIYYNYPELTDNVDVHNMEEGRQITKLTHEILGRLSLQNDFSKALKMVPDLPDATLNLTTAFHVIQWGDTPFNMLNKLDREKRSYYLLAMKLLHELETAMPASAAA